MSLIEDRYAMYVSGPSGLQEFQRNFGGIHSSGKIS
jgi:hypothetical protein